MSLFSALGATSQALITLQRALDVAQNNVNNASSPGYVRQRMPMISGLFEPEAGLSGGVSAGQIQSSRSSYSEQMVRRQASLLGRFEEIETTLSQVETVFDVTGEAGISRSLSQLFDSFSALSVAPNDPVARQAALARAAAVARDFNAAARQLGEAQAGARREVAATVDRINDLAARVAEFNAQIRGNASAGSDPGLDAQIHAALEDLSQYADVQALHQADGSFTLLLGGQTPLVIGERQYAIQADLSQASPRLRDAQGVDVTAQVSSGRLSGALHAANTLIPGYTASLNLLAQNVADAVNTSLAAGVDMAGAAGAPLFSYNTGIDAASTLAVTAITPARIAAAAAGAPGGNGNALNLAALGNTAQAGGVTFAAFYGSISAAVGRDLSSAMENRDTQTQLLSQARSLRAELSAVNIDEEATRLIEYQRAYQAAAKMVTILDRLTEDTINMLR